MSFEDGSSTKKKTTKKESNYSYIGGSQDREKAVDYANNHMAKEQRDDDWQDDSAMVEIIFSAKGVALYGTTLADNVRSPMSMFRKHCHKNGSPDTGSKSLISTIKNSSIYLLWLNASRFGWWRRRAQSSNALLRASFVVTQERKAITHTLARVQIELRSS